jgi:hypothetical protein
MKFILVSDLDGALPIGRGGFWAPLVAFRDQFWQPFFAWAAPTTVFCGMLLSGCLVGLYQSRPALDTQSRAFAVASVDAIASSWTMGELAARAIPDLAWSTYAQDARVFRQLRRLGAPVNAIGCLGNVSIAPSGAKNIVTARYACPMSWPHAQSVAVVSLRKDLDAWKVTGLYVSPPTPLARGSGAAPPSLAQAGPARPV